MNRDICRSCQHRSKCPERSRGIACTGYKKMDPSGGNREESRTKTNTPLV